MKNTYRILPIYAGDVSGVASALYELGGMVVMHDPSGCNSTYNTHDETRWYQKESLIYISGLTERDAIFGNDTKFIKDICLAAEELHPRFIALCSAPIPFLNGTDFVGIARMIEKETKIPTFFVPTNGMHDYSKGAGAAFLELAKHMFAGQIAANSMVEASNFEAGPGKKINLLGLTPLDFDGPNVVGDIRKAFADYEIISCWAMEDSCSNLLKAPETDLNVVLSVTGLPLARWMDQTFGIPYVCGLPLGQNLEICLPEINSVINDKLLGPHKEKQSHEQVFLVGEPVFMKSLADYLLSAFSIHAKVVNPLEEAFEGADFQTCGEEDLEKLLEEADLVIGDPFYRYVVGPDTSFVEISHQAFSGRSFRGQRRNLFCQEELEELCDEIVKAFN